MKIQNSINELIEERKKLNEISYALFGQAYIKLEDTQKQEVDQTYRLYTEEKKNISVPTMEEILSEVKEMKTRKDKNGGILGYKSGIDFEEGGFEFDEIISGWQPGKVYTIAGYSNVGKSNFTYWLLTKQLDKKIIFFSTEVNKGMVLQNLVKSFYGISFYEALDKIVNDEKKIKEDFKNLTIFDDVVDFDTIKNIVEHEKPDIVVLDFVQGLTAGSREMYEKNAFLARSIQRMAIDNGTIVFSVAQITAGSLKEAKKEGVFTVKGAGEYFESSDVILHIFRPAKSEAEDLILRVEKNKFGPLKEFEITAQFKTGQFSK